MDAEYQTVYAPPAIAQIKGAVREPLLYPSFKVVLVFTSAPAMVGLLVGLYVVLTTLTKDAIIVLPIYVFMAEVLYGLSALIAGIIINKYRWEKNAADVCKAAITCSVCAALPTALIDHNFVLNTIFGLDFSLEMNTIAGVMGFILAILVLPSAHTLGSHELALQTTDQIAPISLQSPDNNVPN